MEETEAGTVKRLMEAFVGFHRVQWKRAASRSLKPSEAMILILIKRKSPPGSPGLKVSEISRLMGVKPPTVTQLVNGLVSGGCLERQVDGKDRRAVNVSLTAKGSALANRAFAGMVEDFSGLHRRLGEARSRELIELLSETSAYFGRIGDEGEVRPELPRKGADRESARD